MNLRVMFFVVNAIVSAGGLLLLYTLVNNLYWSPLSANILVVTLGLWFNYKLHQRLTWKHLPEYSRQVNRFVLSRISTTALGVLVFDLLVQRFATHYLLANLVGVGVSMVMNLLVSDNWVLTTTDPSHDLTLTPKTFGKVMFLIACIALAVRLASPSVFFSVVFTVLAVLALAAIMLNLVAGLYVHRDDSSWQPLHELPDQHGLQTESIAVLMPARHEGEHYGATIINAAWTQRDHPSYRIFPVVNDDDPDTLRAALTAAQIVNGVDIRECAFYDLQAAFKEAWAGVAHDSSPLTPGEIESSREYALADALVQPMVFPLGGQQPSKPKQLNYGFDVLKHGDFTAFTILDAESIAQPGLFTYADYMLRSNPTASVVQGAVQLMDPPLGATPTERFMTAWRRWFSWHNLLEYHRWFSGQMTFQSDNEFVPLGGNTLFVRTEVLRQTSGWPLSLTEDCALGVKISAQLKGRVIAFYKPVLATREETPPTVWDLIKQRTRWHQGFLESFVAGQWQAMPTFRQRFLAFWILSHPFFQGFSAVLIPVAIVMMVTGVLKSPVLLVLIMFLPIMLSVLMIALQLEQLRDFSLTYHRNIPWVVYVIVALTQPLYQWILSFAAMRAALRHFTGQTTWQSPARSGDLTQHYILGEMT